MQDLYTDQASLPITMISPTAYPKLMTAKRQAVPLGVSGEDPTTRTRSVCQPLKLLTIANKRDRIREKVI